MYYGVCINLKEVHLLHDKFINLLFCQTNEDLSLNQIVKIHEEITQVLLAYTFLDLQN